MKARSLGCQLAWLLEMVHLSQKEKEAWEELIPEMSLKQIDRFIHILEAILMKEDTFENISFSNDSLLDAPTKHKIVQLFSSHEKRSLLKDLWELLKKWKTSDKDAQKECQKDLETLQKTHFIKEQERHNKFQYDLRLLRKEWKLQKEIHELKEKIGFL
jgi:hypothetical protein